MENENINSTLVEGEQQLPAMEAAKPDAEAGKDALVKDESQTPIPPEKTYKEEEWTQREKHWTKRLSGLQSEKDTRIKQLEQSFQELDSQIQEQRYNDFLSRVQESGGDMTIAQKMVLGQKELAKAQAEHLKQLSDFQRDQEKVDAGMKILVTDELIRKYELPITARAKLLEAEGAAQAEILALNMRLEKEKAERKPSTKVDSGLGQKPVVDVNKLTPYELILMGVKQKS